MVSGGPGLGTGYIDFKLYVLFACESLWESPTPQKPTTLRVVMGFFDWPAQGGETYVLPVVGRESYWGVAYAPKAHHAARCHGLF
jgi:hypothetical protein